MTAFIHAYAAIVAGQPVLTALLIFASAMSEAILLVGAVVPGTTVILGLAALAGASSGLLVIAIITVAAILGAVAGDGVSYWIGHRYGARLAELWPLRTRPELLERGERYFARRGGASVFIARFVPGIRCVVPVVAGMAGMASGRFYAANISSAVIWSLTLVLPAAGLGTSLARVGHFDPRVLTGLAALVLFAATAWLAARRRQRVVPSHRA
jgi:membrane protein DedA with SNARE-associated domain